MNDKYKKLFFDYLDGNESGWSKLVNLRVNSRIYGPGVITDTYLDENNGNIYILVIFDDENGEISKFNESAFFEEYVTFESLPDLEDELIIHYNKKLSNNCFNKIIKLTPDYELVGEDTVCLGVYIPKRIHPDQDKYSKSILSVKDNSNTQEIPNFSAILDKIIAKDIAVCCVPSHNPENLDTGIRKIAKRLADNKRIDATSCLVRHKLIDKQSIGGKRNKSIHLESIMMKDPGLIKEQEVLIIDDVYTTGNSMSACKEILYKNGAKTVCCVALGRTKYDFDMIEML